MTCSSPSCRPLRAAVAALALATPICAPAAMHVYEPFEYPAASIIAGTPARGLGLQGAYVGSSVPTGFELRASAPGLGYGGLAGAPAPLGVKLTQLIGTTAAEVAVDLAVPLEVPSGSAIYFSALFTFDDSLNGNHRASITLTDDASGDFLTFGEPVVGVRALRVAAQTAATGGIAVAAGADNAFDNGQTLLLIGHYTNAAGASRDHLELIGYDTADTSDLPARFDASDPGKAFYYELADIDIDLGRISSLAFTIRGTDNNFIDEVRIGSSYADVAAIPEPKTWLLMLCGVAGVVTASSVRRGRRRRVDSA